MDSIDACDFVGRPRPPVSTSHTPTISFRFTVLLERTPVVYEVAVIALDGAEPLEAFESRVSVDGVCAAGESLLAPGALPSGVIRREDFIYEGPILGYPIANLEPLLSKGS